MRSATNPQARIDSMRLNHKQIAACTGGSFMVEPLDPRALATGLTWDSRDAKPGDVYVALTRSRATCTSRCRASAWTATTSSVRPSRAVPCVRL